MRFFFYGTLVDADVRARVLGRAAALLRVTGARAPGWRAVYAAGKPYPVLVRTHRAVAAGVLAEGARPGILARLTAYEKGYRLRRIAVLAAGRPVTAAVFLPRRALRAGPRLFDLQSWQRIRKRDYLKRMPTRG